MDNIVDTTTYFQAALSSMAEGIFLVNTRNLIVYCNAQLARLVGLRDNGVIGQPYHFLFGHLASLCQDSSKTERELEAASKNTRQQPVVYLRNRYPLTGHFQIGLFPLYDSEGNAVGWGGLVRDGTEEREGTNEQGTHVANFIPELRASLATIRGLVGMLMSSAQYWDAHERQSFLGRIFEDVDKLGRYLDNSQELFKLERGTKPLYRSRTEIKVLLTSVIDILASRSHVEFSLDIPAALPPIDIDPNWIERVLVNLLDYILRQLPGSNHLPIAVRLQDGEAIFSVTVNDSHVPLDEFIQAFTPAGAGQLERGGPLGDDGFGLYVARKLAIAHGGRLSADRIGQRGVIIRLSIPTEAPFTEVAATPRPMAHEALAKLPTKQPQSVIQAMVIEDDPEMLRLLKRILEAERYRVNPATSGKQAIEFVKSSKPDIVLMDLSLPDMNGFDLYTELREYTSAPLLVVTGDTRAENAARALDLGVDDYVTKPFSPQELMARVRVILRRVSGIEAAQINRVLRIGELSIDFARRQVRVRGTLVKLTPLEYKVLSFLAINSGMVLSRSRILSMVWGSEYNQDVQYLWVIVSRLRKKIEKDPAKPAYILTEAGIGYYVPAPTDTKVLLD